MAIRVCIASISANILTFVQFLMEHPLVNVTKSLLLFLVKGILLWYWYWNDWLHIYILLHGFRVQTNFIHETGTFHELSSEALRASEWVKSDAEWIKFVCTRKPCNKWFSICLTRNITWNFSPLSLSLSLCHSLLCYSPFANPQTFACSTAWS